MYKKNLNSEKALNRIMEVIKEFSWQVQTIFIENNCVFGIVKKTDMRGNEKIETEGFYAASDDDKSDVFNVYEGLLERLNFELNKIEEKDNVYNILTLVPFEDEDLSEEDMVNKFKFDLIRLYDMFLDNKENSPIETLKIALEHLRSKFEMFMSYNKTFRLSTIKVSVKLDSEWSYWNVINDVQIKEYIAGGNLICA